MTNQDLAPKTSQSRGHEDAEEELISTVETKEDRKLRARRKQGDSVWFGFGMFGMVGWSIALPTIACLAIGLWIDRRWPSPYSWTLMFLFVGIVLGCVNGWYWVTRERKQIDMAREDES